MKVEILDLLHLAIMSHGERALERNNIRSKLSPMLSCGFSLSNVLHRCEEIE